MNDGRKGKNLLDASGRPLAESTESDLSAEIQHYIDSKIRFGVEDIRKEQNRKWVVLAATLTLISGTLGWSLYSIWKSVPTIVQAQFVEPQIKVNVDRILEEKTKAYIAGRLDPVEKQVKDASEDIARRTEDANAKLKQVEALIAKFSQAERDLVEKTEFATLVIDAQSDDRTAYDKLRQIAADLKNPFHERARQSANEVMNKHSMPFEVGGDKVPWAEGTFPNKLSLKQLAESFDTNPGWVKHALINYVSSRIDIPRIERLDFMVHVMKEDKSLEAVEAAGRRFGQETSQEIKPLATDYFLEWWAKNRDLAVKGLLPAPKEPYPAAEGVAPASCDTTSVQTASERSPFPAATNSPSEK
jgi:hypothetical protein